MLISTPTSDREEGWRDCRREVRSAGIPARSARASRPGTIESPDETSGDCGQDVRAPSCSARWRVIVKKDGGIAVAKCGARASLPAVRGRPARARLSRRTGRAATADKMSALHPDQHAYE